ncbi:hypothetical protein BGZ83_008124 [Gryganskiella cystojenkinii]|nr:hypothetical protein BGZ83_008124 [Gryganskiella cystojenkinii]
MHKSIFFLSAIFAVAGSASAYGYELVVKNNAGVGKTFSLVPGDRYCYCLRNTQTNTITGKNGGDIKLFSKSDCTGNFATLGSNSQQNNAQWVNSVSFGESGIPSGSSDYCPNWIS